MERSSGGSRLARHGKGGGPAAVLIAHQSQHPVATEQHRGDRIGVTLRHATEESRGDDAQARSE